MGIRGQNSRPPERLAEISARWIFGRHTLEGRTGSYCTFDEQPTNSPHRHNHYEICLVLSGHGIFYHGGASHALGPGVLFLADPGVVHEITSFETRDLRLVFFSFSIEVTPSPIAESDENRLLAAFLREHRLISRAVGDLADYLPLLRPRALPRANQSARVALLETLLAMISLLAGIGPEAGGATERPGAVRKALDWLDLHFRGKVREAEVARAAAVSERTLRRLLRRHCGQSLATLVNERRIGHAVHRLLMGFTVGQVAREVGIEDPGQFSRLFKRHLGCPPKVFQGAHAPTVPRTEWSGDSSVRVS